MKGVMFVAAVLGLVAVKGQGVALARGGHLDSVAARVMAAPLSHPVRVSTGGVNLEWRGLYMSQGLLWLSFRAVNHSAIDFRGDAVRVYIRDRRGVRRRAVQERALRPVYRSGTGVMAAGGAISFCVGLVPRVQGKGEELVVEWVERNGDRRMMAAVRGKRVLKAVKIN